MIDVRQMRYFVALAETLHFGRAAERLNLTQPPLSRQMAALEKELGVKLLERHSRHANLTHAGQRFLEDSRAVIAAFDQACRNARQVGRGEQGDLSIGFMMHAAYTVVPGLARRYMDAFPEVQLSLREVLPTPLVEELLHNRVDAGILFDPGPVRGLERQAIYSERLCLAVHPDHPLAGRDQVGPKDLEGQPLIATPAETTPTLRQSIVDYCRRGGFAPTIRLEALILQTIVSLVREKLGIALVPDSMRTVAAVPVAYCELEDAPTVEHVVAWRADNLNPALRPFLTVAGVGT